MYQKDKRRILCKDCNKPVECSKHGSEQIDEYQHDMNDSWYYSCGKCVVEDGLALGSIVHWCKEGILLEELDGVEVIKP